MGPLDVPIPVSSHDVETNGGSYYASNSETSVDKSHIHVDMNIDIRMQPTATVATATPETPSPELPLLPRWRRMIRNFTPSWFAVTMGTGIVSILLYSLPYRCSFTTALSYCFFALNVVMFVVFTVISVLRYMMYHDCWRAMVHHPVQSLFLGCFPMGLSTIINMSTISLSATWGAPLLLTVWVLWWLNVVSSLATCLFVPWMVIYRHKPGLNTITAALILPIVATVVCAASGGLVALHLPDAGNAQLTIIVSYILWGLGEYFCAIIICLYFHRLTMHSLPPRDFIVSVFLPIGALGNGGFGIINLGLASLKTFPKTGLLAENIGGEGSSLVAGRVLYVIGVLVGLCCWGFGMVLLSFALISIFTTKRFPFNMGWWGFTFPMGVLATCTGLLAQQLDSIFFRVMTMLLSIAVIILWFIVSIKTVLLARRDLVAESFPEYPLWKKEFQPE
ncbi:Sulfite efflux pump SSU1 [Ceratocystis fimbriata CBS 114723]|uniref:Sulfite efflux pump SSU1 n=1 Tax=Ceratocystis fimbriata CBS 114723 TaxID=1035309 RepID=A0A2C5WZA1_9PEZI|nr:Sulfite efflux pump SSU1 [Ceratocystis fimbriata CBS 114723]